MGSDRCSVTEYLLGRSMHAVRIENDLLAAVILLDKGADIYQMIYKPRQTDVLWKSPWGMKDPAHMHSAFGSSVLWLEAYAGGWQEIFPSGGGPCTYKGVELNFHGEASMTAWDCEVLSTGNDVAEIRLSTRLHRSPFRIERRMRVEAGSADLILRETITNEGGETMEYMWGHHPAYGAPFISDACRIDIGTRSLRADDAYVGTANPLTVDRPYTWPLVERDGQTIDLSCVPGQSASRDTLAYFENFDRGWYGITNTALGFGVGLVWPKEIFPYAWLWQEMNASPGYPWYKGVYVMAIEPFSSIPGQGLVNVIEKTGTQRTLKAGETVEAELRAVFYETTKGIEGISADGTVKLRKD